MPIWRHRSTFHDEIVSQFFRPSVDALDVELTRWRLEFLGVRQADVPAEPIEKILWLYDEIDAAPAGRFVVRAIFDDGEMEVEVAEVRVFDKASKRYVIPEEPPPPPPTLFLDRGGPAKRKKR